MGKSKKSNNKVNKPECYVLLSRKITDGITTEQPPKPNEVMSEDRRDFNAEDVVREATASFNLTSFERIRDATIESNELIKEIIYNVRLLRKEVADLAKHVKKGGSICQNSM